jgi:PAS domain S-box-containing protein
MTRQTPATDGWSSDVFGPKGDGAGAARADLVAIFDTIDLPVVVVGHELTVSCFNRAAAAALGLTPSHIGQSPRDVRVLTDVSDLEKLCARVIADGAPCRREVRHGGGWFLLRLAPYPGSDHRIGGAVLTLTNVTAFRASIEQAIYEREYTKAILNTVIAPLVVLDADLRVQTANRSFYEMFRVSRDETQGVPLSNLRNHAWDTPWLWVLLKETLSDNKEFKPLEVEHDFPAIGRRTLWLDARRLSRDSTSLILLALQDITDRKRAEDALRESEERYRTLFNTMDEGFCTIEVLFDDNQNPVDYRFLEVNGAFEKQTGIKDARGRLMRQIAPHHEQHWFDIYGKIALTGESMRFENPAKELHRWYDVYAFRVGLPAQRQVAILFNDITERRQAEQEVRRQRGQLATFLETAALCLHRIGPDGTILWANEAELETLGYAREEYFGHHIAEFHVDQDVIADILTRLNHGEKLHEYEARLRCKDGSIKTVLVDSSVLREEGRFLHTQCFTRDITDRKRAEEALREQTERLRLLWEAAAVLLTADAPDAMLRGLLAKIGSHLGVDTYFNYMVNDAGDALRLASCEGIPVETARTITRLEFGQSICGTVALHRQPIVATYIQQTDDPKAQVVKSFGIRAYACNPLVSENLLLGTLSFASRSRDEFTSDELTFLKTICHYVTLAYERLRLLNQLREADQRKDEFLATLAHELRNPLAPVLNAVQVLRLKGSDQPEVRWSRDVIERQVEHMTRLIDDLLDISRITRNKLELRKQRIELAEVIHGAVESSRPAIEQYGHELTVTLPPDPAYLNGDLVRLAQVFLNLLSNAAKYTERGGRIWLNAERQGSDVVVRVKDTGVGIPAEKLPRLFEMFFQVDRSLERSQGGLGIGLSLVRRLVELHGGRVEARSEGAGKGSEFIVRLPILVEKPTATHEPTRNGVKEATTARRILVVDDKRDSADSLAMLLRLTGNEAYTAYDGVEGVEAAERFRPELVLLDIGMPRLNGYDACRRIREQPWGKTIVLVALTGWGQEEDRRRTVEAGFDAHMVKPVDPTALMKLLASQPQAPECQLTNP